MAWGKVWLRVPETIKFVYSGRPGPWVTGKDLILHTIGLIGVDGALYQAMEFTGEAIESLTMDARFTMCNMAIEAGGKSGIVGPDEKTTQYLQSRPDGSRARTVGKVFASDPDAEYAQVLEIDAAAVQPTVSKPHLPSNTAAAADCGDITIDQVVIGSCTNGRLDDLRQAADILRGSKVHPDVRCIVLPGTQEVCLDAIADGTMQTFIEAGCAFSTPTCGAVPRRPHGRPRRGRARRRDHQPQLRRPHGPPRQPRSTWPARTWPPPRPWPATSPHPKRSAP